MFKQAILQNSRFLVLLLLAAGVLAALYFFREVILPFAVAAFLAYLIAPVISRISRLSVRGRNIHRSISIVIVYTLSFGLLSLGGFYLVPKLTSEVNKLVRELPVILRDVEQKWIAPLDTKVNAWLAEFVPISEPEKSGELAALGETKNGQDTPEGGPPAPGGAVVRLAEDYTYIVQQLDEGRFEIIPKRRVAKTENEPRKNWDFSRQITAGFRQFRTHFETNIVQLLRLSQGYFFAIVGSLFTTFLVLMTSAFILLDPDRINAFMCSLVPKHYQPTYEQWIGRLDHGLAGVVRGQLMICCINGTMTAVGISIIGVPFVLTLTFIATVFSLIPIFGVLISTVPIILMGLTVSMGTALAALGWILVIHFFEGNFLNPKIMGDSSRIHPVLIIFALVAGEYLGGIMGALVAVPAFSLVQNSFLFLKGLAEEFETAA